MIRKVIAALAANFSAPQHSVLQSGDDCYDAD
jgi:hypothetical protein